VEEAKKAQSPRKTGPSLKQLANYIIEKGSLEWQLLDQIIKNRLTFANCSADQLTPLARECVTGF